MMQNLVKNQMIVNNTLHFRKSSTLGLKRFAIIPIKIIYIRGLEKFSIFFLSKLINLVQFDRLQVHMPAHVAHSTLWGVFPPKSWST
jgi:hypothetical protein